MIDASLFLCYKTLMIVLIKIFLGLFLLLAGLILVNKLRPHPRLAEALNIVMNGMREAFRGCGFCYWRTQSRPELYRWQTMDDMEVCEDCLERASWEPMDIADWMKHGLPGTPEAETHCGKNCRCELILLEDSKILTPK